MVARKSTTPLRDPCLGDVPEWRAIARGLGWPESELKTIESARRARTPNDDGIDAVVVLVERGRIVTATPQRVDRWTRYERLAWGYSTWRRDIVVPKAVSAQAPAGYRWCDEHSAFCPEGALPGHDDSETVEICAKHSKHCHIGPHVCTVKQCGHDAHECEMFRCCCDAYECKRDERHAAALERVSHVLRLDHGDCSCRRALLGEHYPDCRHFKRPEVDWDELFATTAAKPRVVKNEIDEAPKAPKGKHRVLSGQGKLL